MSFPDAFPAMVQRPQIVHDDHEWGPLKSGSLSLGPPILPDPPVTGNLAGRYTEVDFERQETPVGSVPPNILREALAVTQGPRQEAYGPPADNWGRTAEIASALLGRPMTPSDCCKVALAMKFARLRQTPKHRDSIVDIAGYSWVLSELEGV